jgi:UDP-N-acetylmuramoyl-L-alanyl-D-glutamate--2,6-diaminopimelate ligase
MLRKIVKLIIPRALFKRVEPFGHLLEAVFFNVINGFPGRDLKVIGVTGTNGKTTTSFMIQRMLHEAGFKVGLMTTVAYGVGADIKPQIAHMTTVSVPLLMKRLKYMRSQGADWLVLEVTSHALAQNRVWGVPFSLAVMTNVTHEHLDYHGTFERYLAAKVKLFKLARRNRAGLRTGVVNADDPNAKAFTAAAPHSLTYGLAAGELQAAQIKADGEGSQFVAKVKDRELKLSVRLPGEFNIANALAAAGAGVVLGLTDQQIEQGIAALEGVEGRMETVDAGQDFSVIVDFAHTPDSFEKLLPAVKKVTKGKLIVVFGSAGRRDEAKRPIQGQLAGQFADLVIITEEDDRDVDGVEIMKQIAAGATRAGKVRDKDLHLIHDRAQAIEFAVKQAQKGDTVLLLGKGHEKTIERADGEHPWNELEVARAALKRLSS